MSLNRLIFYSAILGGWAAFVGWLICELIFFRTGWLKDTDTSAVILVALLVGAAIGGGLGLVAFLASGQLKGQMRRLVPGLIRGALGGALRGLGGNGVVAVRLAPAA